MARRRVRVAYVLWALTLLVASWSIAVVSAFLAGRSKIWVKIDSEAGIINE